MSVEITGQQGYDYQYLITNFLALHALDMPEVKVYVEKEGGEDAEISTIEGHVEKTIEIQAKSTYKDIGLEELVDWLQHFSNGKSDENLLSRLSKNEHQFVVFVTRGRCKDEVRQFVSTSPMKFHNNPPLNREGITKYIETLGELYGERKDGASDLKQKRAEFCQQQKQEIMQNRTIFKDVLKRVQIMEMQNEEAVEQEIIKLLNMKYRIPQNQTRKIALELDRIIRKVRNERGNLVPDFNSVLKKFSGENIFFYDIDVKRPEKDSLIEYLKENNILLLTGISFCGKTHLARSIAYEFQGQGYHCREETDVSSAIRFLSDSSLEERLCILEDPFGHLDLEDSSHETWARIEDFVSRIRPNRKLIVTSKRDLINLYNKTDKLEESSIQGIPWIDITVKDKRVILNLWKEYSVFKEISMETQKQIIGYIESLEEEHLLQPGQVRNLALETSTNVRNLSPEEIEKLAIVDARKIGGYFNRQNDDFKKVILILGLGATTISSIHENEIAYVWESTGDLPSINWSKTKDIIEELKLEFENSSEDFPLYQREYTLDDFVINIIDDLHTRGFISIQQSQIKFVHPTFLEAAKYIQYRLSRRTELKWLLELLQKEVSCLDSKVALNATRQLKGIYHEYSTNKNIKEEIITYSLHALSSIFPSVRDEALSFLITIFDTLVKEQQDEILRHLKTKPAGNSNLKWHEGRPWILEKIGHSLGDLAKSWLHSFRLNEEELKELKNKFFNQEQHQDINLEEMWTLIENYGRYEINQGESKELLSRALVLDEAFIRSKAAYLLMKYFASQDEYITLVFQDPHPYVVYQGIRGIFKGWCSFSEDTCLTLVEKIQLAFTDPSVSVVAHRFMLDFGDEYGHDNIGIYETKDKDKKEKWEIWSMTFPILMRSMHNIGIKESDLYNTVKNAVNYLSIGNYIEVIKSWLDWINKKLPTHLLNTYGLAVADLLLVATKDNPSVREPITTEMLQNLDTHFITVTIAEYINCWENLSLSEKETINLLLHSKRVDSCWIKAVALTRENVPKEIQEWILGQENILEFSEEEVINEFPTDLLIDCIRVYLGHPQPLWWIGLHSSGGKLWERVISALLEKTEHPAFPIVLREWTDRFTDGNYFLNSEQETLKVWSRICSTRDRHINSLAFNMLLKWSVSKVEVKSKALWNIFFKENQEERDYYELLLLNYIECIESRNERLSDVFGEAIFNDRLFPKLTADYLIVEAIYEMKQSKMEAKKIYDSISELLDRQYQEQPPKLYLTNEIVKNLCKESSSEKAKIFMKSIDKVIEDINQKVGKQEEEFYDNDELIGWNRASS